MTRFDTFLVPMDFSADSHAALQMAVAMARASQHGKLHLLHAFELRLPSNPPYGVMLPETYLAQLRGVAERRLDEVAQTVSAAGVACERHLANGYPVDVICETARRVAADVVVMGTRGLTGLEHVLLGSIAERTVRRAPCPVLTLRAPDTEDAAAASADFQRIVVPLDFTKGSEAALRLALEISTERAELHLVHVHEPPAVMTTHYGVDLPESIWEDVRNAANAQLARALAQVEARGRKGAMHVELGRPAHAIAETARKVSADLIVMGTHGRSGLSRWRLGSVAERTLQIAGCPVLTVRSSDD